MHWTKDEGEEGEEGTTCLFTNCNDSDQSVI